MKHTASRDRPHARSTLGARSGALTAFLGRFGVSSIALFVLLAAGCNKAARDWRADDHDEMPAKGQVSALPSGAAGGGQALVEAAWFNNCAQCHGRFGKGDGPNGPMVNAPDLTKSELMDSRTDAQLAAAITSGKGKMPAFGTLPPAVLGGLIQRLRALRGS